MEDSRIVDLFWLRDPRAIEAGVTAWRYETDLDSILRQAVGEMYRHWEGTSDDTADFEMYLGLLKGWLVADGALSGDPAERYGAGSLEDNDVRAADEPRREDQRERRSLREKYGRYFPA